jgi:hypothetical protein
MNKVLNLVTSISIKGNHKVVMLEQRAPVGHCEKRDLQLLCLVVKLSLHVHAHCACAFV